MDEKDIRLFRADGKRQQNRRKLEERCRDAAANLPRKRDVNLSHCGNAISRMWSPFGWVRNGVLARRETPRQGIRCLLPPDQIFPAAKCGVVKSEVLKHEPPPKRAAAWCEVLCHVLRIKEIDVPAGSAKRQDSSIFHS